MAARIPSEIVNFAAGPAKLPQEVTIAMPRFFFFYPRVRETLRCVLVGRPRSQRGGC